MYLNRVNMVLWLIVHHWVRKQFLFISLILICVVSPCPVIFLPSFPPLSWWTDISLPSYSRSLTWKLYHALWWNITQWRRQRRLSVKLVFPDKAKYPTADIDIRCAWRESLSGTLYKRRFTSGFLRIWCMYLRVFFFNIVSESSTAQADWGTYLLTLPKAYDWRPLLWGWFCNWNRLLQLVIWG